MLEGAARGGDKREFVFEDDDGTVYLFYQGKATLTGDYQLSCLKVEFVD